MTQSIQFVTKILVATNDDSVLLSFSGPAGQVENGEIANVEVSRLVLGQKTLRAVAEVLSAKVLELDKAACVKRVFAETPGLARRPVADDEDEKFSMTTH